MSNRVSLGLVSEIWRYPVKSMAGERLAASEVTERGLLGDRAMAIIDATTGLVASAKNPRAWPNLLAYQAAFIEAPTLNGLYRGDSENSHLLARSASEGSRYPSLALRANEKNPNRFSILPSVRITTPEGGHITNPEAELSAIFGRPVTLSSCPPERPTLQQAWTNQDDTDDIVKVTEEAMPSNTFFDLAFVNVLLTTTIERLSAAYPQGRFAIRRFRPNIVITPHSNLDADPEAAAVGQTLCIGTAMRLHVDSRCARCIMTTLAQPDLAKDPGILRAVTHANAGFAGLNSSVMQSGMVRVGDEVWREEA